MPTEPLADDSDIVDFICFAEDDHYLCTLKPDHEGRHKAWADRGDKGHDGREGSYIAHEWEQE